MTQRLIFALPVVIFLIVAGYFVWGLIDPNRDPNAVPSALVENPAPDFDLAALPGSDIPGFATADLKGRLSVVNFFASWCLPCRAEHPLLLELAKDPDLQIIGIAWRDKPADTLEWVRELGNPYARIGVDETARAGIDWGVSGVPETFIVDPQGRIRYQHIGPVHVRDLERKILPILEELNR